MPLFASIFCTIFSWYGEYVVRFSLPDGVFLPCDHGLDFLHQLICEKSINQSKVLVDRKHKHLSVQESADGGIVLFTGTFDVLVVCCFQRYFLACPYFLPIGLFTHHVIYFSHLCIQHYYIINNRALHVTYSTVIHASFCRSGYSFTYFSHPLKMIAVHVMYHNARRLDYPGWVLFIML